MRYLEINNDLYTSGIKDEFGNYLDRSSSDVPEWAFEKLDEFALDIESIISAGKYKLRANYKKCYEIDSGGFKIKEELESTGNFKVKYFSLFLNKYLFTKPKITDYPRPGFLDKVFDLFDKLIGKTRFS